MNFLDNLKLTVGKHKNETFAYVYENDREYCDYIFTKKHTDESLISFSRYVELRRYVDEYDNELTQANNHSWRQTIPKFI